VKKGTVLPEKQFKCKLYELWTFSLFLLRQISISTKAQSRIDTDSITIQLYSWNRKILMKHQIQKFLF